MEDVTERWLPVVRWEGLYEVSDLGHVRSLPRLRCRGQVLKPELTKFGYHRVCLSAPTGSRSYMVHVLVAEAFIGPRPDGLQTRHLDGNPLNNRPWNLTWGTPSENMYDKVRHGTHHQLRKTHCPAGHPYDEANTYIQWNGVSRGCRTCLLARKRRWKKQQSARLK